MAVKASAAPKDVEAAAGKRTAAPKDAEAAAGKRIAEADADPKPMETYAASKDLRSADRGSRPREPLRIRNRRSRPRNRWVRNPLRGFRMRGRSNPDADGGSLARAEAEVNIVRLRMLVN